MACIVMACYVMQHAMSEVEIVQTHIRRSIHHTVHMLSDKKVTPTHRHTEHEHGWHEDVGNSERHHAIDSHHGMNNKHTAENTHVTHHYRERGDI